MVGGVWSRECARKVAMPVRRDTRTNRWFFRTTVYKPDGTRVRLFGTPGIPGDYHAYPNTKQGAQAAELALLGFLGHGGERSLKTNAENWLEGIAESPEAPPALARARALLAVAKGKGGANAGGLDGSPDALLVTGLARLRAGQTVPVNSGKLFVEWRRTSASSHFPRYTRSFQSGMMLPSGQPPRPELGFVQNGMPQSMQRAACSISTGSGTGRATCAQSPTRSCRSR